MGHDHLRIGLRKPRELSSIVVAMVVALLEHITITNRMEKVHSHFMLRGTQARQQPAPFASVTSPKSPDTVPSEQLPPPAPPSVQFDRFGARAIVDKKKESQQRDRFVDGRIWVSALRVCRPRVIHEGGFGRTEDDEHIWRRHPRQPRQGPQPCHRR